ncbi:hypothetical protein FKP32DRAFT_285510 [Trametes sanguinea]|nr:hypothetical protein FKP32DRAFT_285510 [Trametes sanguinea]
MMILYAKLRAASPIFSVSSSYPEPLVRSAIPNGTAPDAQMLYHSVRPRDVRCPVSRSGSHPCHPRLVPRCQVRPYRRDDGGARSCYYGGHRELRRSRTCLRGSMLLRLPRVVGCSTLRLSLGSGRWSLPSLMRTGTRCVPFRTLTKWRETACIVAVRGASSLPSRLRGSVVALADTLTPGSMGITYAGQRNRECYRRCRSRCHEGDDPRQHQCVVRTYRSQLHYTHGPSDTLQIGGVLRRLACAAHQPDMRGQGLVLAVEFASQRARARTTPPGTCPCSRRSRALSPRRACSPCRVCTRFIPALKISKENLAKGCRIFVKAVEVVVRAQG